METNTLTLEHIHAAQAELASAMANSDLTYTELKVLQQSSNALRNIERTIVQTVNNALINQLTADATALKDLVAEINRSGEKLARVAAGVEKAAELLDAFLKAAATALGSGLI